MRPNAHARAPSRHHGRTRSSRRGPSWFGGLPTPTSSSTTRRSPSRVIASPLPSSTTMRWIVNERSVRPAWSPTSVQRFKGAVRRRAHHLDRFWPRDEIVVARSRRLRSHQGGGGRLHAGRSMRSWTAQHHGERRSGGDHGHRHGGGGCAQPLRPPFSTCTRSGAWPPSRRSPTPSSTSPGRTPGTLGVRSRRERRRVDLTGWDPP